jgi:chromosome segregation ATPase
MIRPNWSGIWESVVAYKTVFIAIGLLVVLALVAAYISYCGSNWSFNRGIRKEKEAIANKTAEIANKTTRIDELKQERDQDVGELKVLTNNLANANVADENARAEVNRAVANLAKAVNANSNVNATVEDVNRKLDQLEIK